MVSKKHSLKGYCLPLSPEGRSSIANAPPWHFGGDFLEIVFMADEEEVEKLLPPPLELGPNPGLCFVWFVEWSSISGENPDMPFINPDRVQYKELLVAVSCQYKGLPGFIVPYIWVDNDFTLLRGWFQGFPKKLGRIYITRPHPLNPIQGKIGPSFKLKGICEAHGERLATGTLEVTRKAGPEELPKAKFFMMRHFPNIEDPTKPSIHELAESIVENMKYGEVWHGNATLAFGKSELEEVDKLEPVKIIAGHHFSSGFTIKGGRLLHRYM